MGFIRKMSGYAENCALCKFLHSKFWRYTSAGSIPYSWSLYINARRLMPSIKAVRVRFPSCCSSTSIMMRFSTRLISSFKLRSPTELFLLHQHYRLADESAAEDPQKK